MFQDNKGEQLLSSFAKDNQNQIKEQRKKKQRKNKQIDKQTHPLLHPGT